MQRVVVAARDGVIGCISQRCLALLPLLLEMHEGVGELLRYESLIQVLRLRRMAGMRGLDDVLVTLSVPAEVLNIRLSDVLSVNQVLK